MNHNPDDFERSFVRMFRAMLAVWGLAAIVSLFGTGGLIYIAWHFISKFW